MAQGVAVSMFHDFLTVPDYEFMNDVTRISDMLNNLTRRRQEIQDACFNRINYWMRLSIGDSHSSFTNNSKQTNKILLETVTNKYPWVQWQVCTSKGDKDSVAGPNKSVFSQFLASPNDSSVHAVAIPLTEGKVMNLNSKIENWKKLLPKLKDHETDIDFILKKINENIALKDEIESYYVLQGKCFVLGYYTYDAKGNKTAQAYNLSRVLNNMNLHFEKYRQTFAFAVTFKLESVSCAKICAYGICQFSTVLS